MQNLTYAQKSGLYEFLCNFATEKRRLKFEEIALNRTRFITVVLEDIFQPHNASAVLRTCDCFGVQDVHIIENKNKYHINPDVALGSSNWLTLHKYNLKDENTGICINKLKSDGYRVIATTPRENDRLIEDFDITGKTAVLFGTEKGGLSETAIKYSDGFVKIPMYGFTESLNISVSAAVILFSLTERLKKSDFLWKLSKEELIDVKLDWIKTSIKSSSLLEKQYFENVVEKNN